MCRRAQIVIRMVSRTKNSRSRASGKPRFNYRNYPALPTQAKKSKRIRKRVRGPGRVARLGVELVNVGEQVEKEAGRRGLLSISRPTNLKRSRESREKLSRIKRELLGIGRKVAAVGVVAGAGPSSGLPPVSDRLRRAFNNIDEVKGTHADETRVREYVENVLDPKLERSVLILLNRLNVLQRVKRRLEPKRARRRLVFGFNEVQKAVEMTLPQNWPRILVFAVDSADCPGPQATNERLSTIFQIAKRKEIPICFAGTRKELGKALYGQGKGPMPSVAVVAVLNYQVLENEFRKVLELLDSARAEHSRLYQNFLSSRFGYGKNALPTAIPLPNPIPFISAPPNPAPHTPTPLNPTSAPFFLTPSVPAPSNSDLSTPLQN